MDDELGREIGSCRPLRSTGKILPGERSERPMTTGDTSFVESWIVDHPVTVGLTALLTGWYVMVQHGLAAVTIHDLEAYWYFFRFESLGEPTPGWLLSGISHDRRMPILHFGLNVIHLLVFGGLAEGHLRRRTYLLLFLGIGLLGSVTQLIIRPEIGPVNGASSAIFGLGMFATVHLFLVHREELRSVPATADAIEAIVTHTTLGLSYLLPVILPLTVVLEITGFVPNETTAVVSHATGVTIGAVFGLVLPCGDVPTL